ncbi:NHL repeat containing protein [Oopsacas minuta]|uniref:NHL repeat containing protein n=1 Tax=Oopsacas minuta TaxID=111878 RepID=A0AAV7JKI9_9METZ|nr:NHL repeat containing protein [Oopsacas minuta]
MATSFYESSNYKSHFDSTIEKLRNEIKTQIYSLIESLKKREIELLSGLDEIVNTHKSKNKELQQKLEELTELYKANKKNFESSELQYLQKNFLEEIDRKIESTTQQISSSSFPDFTWDDKLLSQIETFGSIKLKTKESIKYTDKITPIVSVCEKGNEKGHLKSPWGLAIDYTSGNIYICDQQNNRIQVFDSGCNFKNIFDISTSLRQPMGIAIHKGNLYVSEGCQDVLVFDLQGQLLKRLERRHRPDSKESSIYGISVHETTGDVFICDFKNNRVQVYSEEFKLKHLLTGFTKPCYVEVTHTHIIVLDKGNPCLHWYDYDYAFVKSLITRGGDGQVENVAAFCLDFEGNILMTDDYSISIFNKRGELIHKIKDDVTYPTGIKLDSKNRIIILSYRDKNCLQMF